MTDTPTSDITVYTARRIHTMSRSAPEATAVAVRDGRILEVGSLETLRPWLERYPHKIDARFADKVILPGFIDPHLHPSLAAVLLPSEFITAFEWDLPGRVVEPCKTPEAYLDRLSSAVAEHDPDAPFFVTWGYHQLWHGAVTRAQLNAISDSLPIIVWHRSFHELILNDAAIAWLEVDSEVMARHPQINADTGRFSEMGAMVALGKLRPHLMQPNWFFKGLQMLAEILHQNGHTMIADMAWGIFDPELEWGAYTALWDSGAMPMRCMLIPRGLQEAELTGDPEEAMAKIEALCARETDDLFTDRHVKFFTDGAFFSELMQVQAPGFLDGHHGEWLTAPEQFRAAVRPYWLAGWRIHVHCTGDLGLELAIDVLAELQEEKPRFDHGYTIEHFGLSTEEQVERLAALGGQVSANVYYLHELSRAYAEQSLGYERASQMARLGSLVRAGVPFALHSDYTMAPASPLNSAWVAVNRVEEDGAVMCAAEKVSVMDALRGITIEAARMLGQQHEVGSIRAGKRADFTVLDADPFEVDPMRLRDIRVHATVFGGACHEVAG